MSADSGSLIWVPDIVWRISRFAAAIELACTLRLVDKASSQLLANYKVALLSLPSPSHAFRERWGNPEAFRAYTRTQRLKLLCLVAASGSIANLEIALANAGLLITAELLEAAAEAGQVDVCSLLRERGCPWGSALAAAARGGHRTECEWLLEAGCPFRPAAVYAAVRAGHEGLALWLMAQQGRNRDDAAEVDVGDMLAAAAEGCSLETLKRLYQLLLPQEPQEQQQEEDEQEEQQHDDGDDDAEEEEEDEEGQQREGREQLQDRSEARGQLVGRVGRGQLAGMLGAAAGSPTPDWRAKVEWLEGLGCPRTVYACECVAGGAAHSHAASSPAGDDDAASRLQWLRGRGRGYVLNGRAIAAAVSHGHLATLRFLVEQAGVQPDAAADRTAAARGHLAVLQYLHAHELPIYGSLAWSAAEAGRLPVVAWAVEALGVEPERSPSLMTAAAASGSVEMMVWLQERGGEVGDDAFENAAESGCEEALEWLVERGCPVPETPGEVYTEAALHGDLATLSCLRRLGCPWGSPAEQQRQLMVRCIRREPPLPALRCLLQLGCPVDWRAAGTEASRQQHRRNGEYGKALLGVLNEEEERRRRAGDPAAAGVEDTH